MIKRGGDGSGAAGRKKVPGPRPIGAIDKDEDLMLFREMQKSEKDRTVSLLQPVSDEFEAGQYSIYAMAPTGKKVNDRDSGQNDYDWLKTPPATPLFPSLEMEAGGPELVVRKEIPIVQPLSRFSGNSQAEKGSTQPTKNLKPKVLPRYSTPSGRPNINHVKLPAEKKNINTAPVLNQKLNQSYNDLNLDQNPKSASSRTKTTDFKEANWNLIFSNLSKSVTIGHDQNAKTTKPKRRGISSPMRSNLPAQIAELSVETPRNLKTDRSTSTYRPRSSSTQQNSSSLSTQKRPKTVNKARRQSSSPGSTRGRKPEAADGNVASQNDRIQTQVLGSRMVDRVLNSRMSVNEEKQSKMKLNASMNEGSDARKSSIQERQNNNTNKFNTSINEGSGFGRLMSKSSLDMALRHMKLQDQQRDAGITQKHGANPGKRAVSVSKRASSTS